MEDKMQNLKYLCSLFAILAVNRVICHPTGEKACNIPPELVKSFSNELQDNIKNCRDEDEIIKFCGDIHQLAYDISDCVLGKMWDMKELRERLIDNSRKMPFDENVDICMNFAHLSSSIKLYSSGDKAVSVQLSRNSEICNVFCKRHPNVCPLLLKLYWVKKTVMEFKNEIDKVDDLAMHLQTPKSDAPSSQNMKPTKPQTQKMVAPTESSKVPETPVDKVPVSTLKKEEPVTDDRTSDKKVPPVASKDLPKTDIINPVPSNTHTLSPPSDETKPKLPVTKNNDNEEENLVTDHQTKVDTVVPNTKKIDESKLENNPTSTANNNAVNSVNLDKNIKKDVSENIDKDVSENINKGISENNNNIDSVVNKKVTNAVDDKTLPEDESKDLPNPVKDNTPESGPNQESEKNDKTEFGNQPNEFSDEFPDPSNDYAEDELPPTVNKEKPEDKTDSDKKLEIPISKGSGMEPAFPEEEDGHFFAYFLTIIVLCIAGYLVFHNKQKIIALIIEGRHERRRRPNGGYKRLDTKDSSKSTSQVIF